MSEITPPKTALQTSSEHPEQSQAFDDRKSFEKNALAANELTAVSKKSSYRENFDSTQEFIDEANRKKQDSVLTLDSRWQPVIDEWNRGEEAWHDALKNRHNEPMQKRRNGGETDLDKLRDGELNGKPREYSPEDLSDATRVRGIAEDIKIDRIPPEEVKKPKLEPTPPHISSSKSWNDRFADLPNSVNT